MALGADTFLGQWQTLGLQLTPRCHRLRSRRVAASGPRGRPCRGGGRWWRACRTEWAAGIECLWTDDTGGASMAAWVARGGPASAAAIPGI